MATDRQNSAGAWGESYSVRKRFGYPAPKVASAAALQRRIEALEARVTELERPANTQRVADSADQPRERLP